MTQHWNYHKINCMMRSALLHLSFTRRIVQLMATNGSSDGPTPHLSIVMSFEVTPTESVFSDI